MWFIQILNHFITIWDKIVPWVIVDEYERGVILRLGLHKKTLRPGITSKIPLIDKVICSNVVLTTLRLEPQTIHTKDGAQVTIIPIVRYEISNIVPYLLEIEDRGDILGDVIPCLVKTIVNSINYEELHKGIEAQVLKKLRSEVNRYGFSIKKLTFVTQAKIKSIRLITDNKAPDVVE